MSKKKPHPYPHWDYIVCDDFSRYGIYTTNLEEVFNNGMIRLMQW